MQEELKAADRRVEDMRNKVALAEKEKQGLESNEGVMEAALEAKQLQVSEDKLTVTKLSREFPRYDLEPQMFKRRDWSSPP